MDAGARGGGVAVADAVGVGLTVVLALAAALAGAVRMVVFSVAAVVVELSIAGP